MQSLRILTWNVQMRSFLMESLDRATLEVEYSAQTEARSHEIAARINNIPYDYDVICLNEVFDEDARDILVDALKAKYPFFVQKADAGVAFMVAGLTNIAHVSVGNLVGGIPLPGIMSRPEDSGLMLFSRYEFDTDEVALVPGAPALPVPATYFGWYSEATGHDILAAKGALGARIKLPSGDTVTVIATHMQADSDDDGENADVRKSQVAMLWEVAEVCRKNALTPVPDPHDVVVVGDFNIEGMFRNYHKLPKEWQSHFGRPGGSQEPVLWDAWIWEQAPGYAHGLGPILPITYPTDPGVTAETNQTPAERRYDYCLLRSDRNLRQRQVQHLFIDRALSRTTKKANYLSDHQPLGIDLHIPDMGAMSALQAQAVVLTPEIPSGTPNVFRHESHLNNGVIHWHRLDEDGTYDLSVVSGGMAVQLEVYAKDDLSSPQIPYMKATSVEGPDKFVVPTAPMFLKTMGKARDTVDPYQLRIRKYTGTSLRNAIVLLQHRWQPGNHKTGAPPSLPTTTFAGIETTNDSLFYSFQASPVTSGRQQTIWLTFAPNAGSAPMRLVLCRLVGNDVLSVIDNSPFVTGAFVIQRDLDPGEYFVLIQRDPAAGFAQASFAVQWNTNLTTILPQLSTKPPEPGQVNPMAAFGAGIADLKCMADTTGWGADDISFSLELDGKMIVDRTFLGGMNDGQTRSILGWIREPLTYVKQLKLSIIEGDDIDNDDIGIIKLPGVREILGSDVPHQFLANGVCDLRQIVEFDDGKYEFHCRVV